MDISISQSHALLPSGKRNPYTFKIMKEEKQENVRQKRNPYSNSGIFSKKNALTNKTVPNYFDIFFNIYIIKFIQFLTISKYFAP